MLHVHIFLAVTAPSFALQRNVQVLTREFPLRAVVHVRMPL